jgi:hypothetical protein
LMPFLRHQALTEPFCLAPLKVFRYSASPIILARTPAGTAPR